MQNLTFLNSAGQLLNINKRRVKQIILVVDSSFELFRINYSFGFTKAKFTCLHYGLTDDSSDIFWTRLFFIFCETLAKKEESPCPEIYR